MSTIHSPYGYTGEWWEDEIGLLYLRARWYQPETGTFLSRDAVESEPPYQYVRGNVVNLTDPSGNVPWREQVASGKASYSCNCGWLDWTHLGGGIQLAQKIFQVLEQSSQSDTIVWNAYLKRESGVVIAAPVSLSITKPTGLTSDQFPGVALGIYKEIQWQVEEFQGVVGIDIPIIAPIGTAYIPIRPGLNSHFSEEDLPSDIIGFYMAYLARVSRQNLFIQDAKTIVDLWCGGLDQQDSLAVYDAYMDELPSGDIGEGGFVRWRQWEGRLANSCTIDGKCSGYQRQWPQTFNFIQETRPQDSGGIWSVDAWQWAYYLNGVPYLNELTYEVNSGTAALLP